MQLIEWLIDNAVWLMLGANVFSLVIGYSIGSARGRELGGQRADRNVPPRVPDPNVRPDSDS